MTVATVLFALAACREANGVGEDPVVREAEDALVAYLKIDTSNPPGNETKGAAFLRDVLGLAWVDSGGGWLIFQLPPSEVAMHPAETSGAAELYLVCDDIEETVRDLEGRGLAIEGGISDQGWGRLATIRLPGGGRLGIYEARHPTAFDL